MIRWPQIVASIALTLMGALYAHAQRPGQQQQQMQPSAPTPDRQFAPSRYTETEVATRLPPIVSKSNASSRGAGPSTAGASKRLSDSSGVFQKKFIPSFETVDPRDAKAVLESTTILAVVGGYHIITGDLIGDVNLILPPEAMQMPPEELEKLRVHYLRMLLGNSIELKLLFVDFMRQERAGEMFAKYEAKAASIFDEQIEDAFNKVKIDPSFRRIAELMVRQNLSTIGEVDVALGPFGTSLAKERFRFAERHAAISVLQRLYGSMNKKEITREQQSAYYEEHLPEFLRPARCKWEKLSVRHTQFDSRADAMAAIAKMGDEVFLRGASLAAVARRSSQTSDSSDGGLHDWTGKDALRSKVLNEAIFELPVGELSDILSDDEGLHIVRVIERDDGGYQSFSLLKTQETIKKKLQEAQMTEIRQAHFEKLKREIAVWNIFDELPEE
jgi:PPIC-type PPIASE domain